MKVGRSIKCFAVNLSTQAQAVKCAKMNLSTSKSWKEQARSKTTKSLDMVPLSQTPL